MRSFAPGFIERQPITQNLLRTVRLLGEYKGKETLFKQQIPQALETLRQVAVIQSTESSNRIEGITAPADRLRALLADKTTPGNRSEQEILGYRDVLNTIHANHERMPFTTGVVRQLHRDLYKYMEREGGRWKPVDNEISEVRADGTKVVRFQPVPAFATAEHMEALHERFNSLWAFGEVEKLILIPAYVLDFLCIHPFLDGNGRIARLVSLLLLYQAGFEVGRYISLEKIVEQTRDSYYDSLYASSRGWHEGEHNLLPWTEYFLGVLVAAYREFEGRVGLLATARGAKTEMVLEAIRHLPESFRMTDVERLSPTVTRDMIRQVFNGLKKDGSLWCEGKGPAAVWHKRGDLL
ncbi:MAG: Fic family protein [Chloroflexota bacterium]